MLNWIGWNRTICMKVNLALNNKQRLICHKTQPTNQPTSIFRFFSLVFFYTVIYKVFLYNTNNFHTVVWFQAFLSNTNNLHTVGWFNFSWRQHPTKQRLYGHRPLITKTIKVRGTRHAGNCWRTKDELRRDVLQCTPSHGRANARRPACTNIQQLCEETGCSPEDLPEAMNNREGWRERVRDICADGMIWWWWCMVQVSQCDTNILLSLIWLQVMFFFFK